MGRPFDSGTHVSLLGRLRRDPTNQAYWAEFVEHYGPKIYAWCRRWGLQEAGAQDVTQNVLLKLADKMRTFTYDTGTEVLTLHSYSIEVLVGSKNFMLRWSSGSRPFRKLR